MDSSDSPVMGGCIGRNVIRSRAFLLDEINYQTPTAWPERRNQPIAPIRSRHAPMSPAQIGCLFQSPGELILFRGDGRPSFPE